MECISSEEGRLPNPVIYRFLMIFGSPGKPKNTQKWKKCLPKFDRKKEGKKGGDDTSPWSSAAAFARPEGMQDSCSGRFLPWFLTIDLHTPPLPAECGGFSSLMRGPPHSTTLPALSYAKKLGQNLGGFCQNLVPQKAAKMGSKSAPGLSKLIFGENAYFVGPVNEIHTFCILKIVQNKPKTVKKT